MSANTPLPLRGTLTLAHLRPRTGRAENEQQAARPARAPIQGTLTLARAKPVAESVPPVTAPPEPPLPAKPMGANPNPPRGGKAEKAKDAPRASRSKPAKARSNPGSPALLAFLALASPRWPAAFPPIDAEGEKPLRPLAAGTREALHEALAGEMEPEAIDAAMREWTRRPSYLRGTVWAWKSGVPRIGLDGSPSGERVKPWELGWARKLLGIPNPRPAPRGKPGLPAAEAGEVQD